MFKVQILKTVQILHLWYCKLFKVEINILLFFKFGRDADNQVRTQGQLSLGKNSRSAALHLQLPLKNGKQNKYNSQC